MPIPTGCPGLSECPGLGECPIAETDGEGHPIKPSGCPKKEE
jgi:hypothetical protein